MTYSLSTNWCNQRIKAGDAIADLALSMGFTELELGYHTTMLQVPGFKRRLDQIPVGSVHAFAPIPLSAPFGHPELYQLASFVEDMRKLAEFQVRKDIAFCADIGADTLVLHAGRVMCPALLKSGSVRKRRRDGWKLLDIFHRELDVLLPDLEKHKVVLALENLPYYEGFPDEFEFAVLMQDNFGGWVKGWFDTGHHRVREAFGWAGKSFIPPSSQFQGMHLNDVVDNHDDHFAPGKGHVDFAALKSFATSVRHRVFEPNPSVTEADLRAGLQLIHKLWD